MTAVRRLTTLSVGKQLPVGLRLIPNFYPHIEACKWSFDLDQEIAQYASDLHTERATTYLSKQHNLKSNESFKRLTLSTFDPAKFLQCQHFEQYGEDGHKLTYFIGTKNIPTFIERGLVKSLEMLPEVAQLKAEKHSKTGNGELDWNFTFNVYRNGPHKPGVVPGFPFHTDIPSNGEITFIYPLLSSATLEMKRELPELHQQQCKQQVDIHQPQLCGSAPSEEIHTYSTELPAAALLMLSGEARWEWQHRVLPQQVHSTGVDTVQDTEGKIWRISLVLGCR